MTDLKAFCQLRSLNQVINYFDQVSIEIKTGSVKNYNDTHPLWVKCSHH